MWSVETIWSGFYFLFVVCSSYLAQDSRLQLKLKPSEEFTQSHHVNNRQLSWDFNFSQVLVDASQEQVRFDIQCFEAESGR